MSVCDKLIARCVSVDCENPMFAGINKTAYIFNKDQISKLTFSCENSNIITGITMGTDGTSSYCGYTVEQLGNQPYNGTQVEMAETNVGNRFTETVSLLIMDHNPDVCKNVVDALASGKFLVIMQNDFVNATGDNKWQVYGSGRGLQAATILREAYGDNEGAYAVTLTQEGGSKSGVFFFVTDLATTDAAIQALLCDCPASSSSDCEDNDETQGTQGTQGAQGNN